MRTTLQALSAVLGGTNSLHTNSLDEALALPTEQAATLALRTQQIIAAESGVAEVVDALGGSYFVERLTQDLVDGALDYFARIDHMGGMVSAIEQGFPQREIADSSYRFQQAVERHDKVIVGVNDYVQEGGRGIETLYVDESAGDRQLARLVEIKATRMPPSCAQTLDGAAQRRPRRRQSDAAHPRRRARVCHPRRDVRCAARRLGRVRGNAHDLKMNDRN